jgi:predicted nuclease with TOPRIM domain
MNQQTSKCTQYLADAQQTSTKLHEVRNEIQKLSTEETALIRGLDNTRSTCRTLKMRWDRGEESIAAAIRVIDDQTCKAIHNFKRTIDQIYTEPGLITPDVNNLFEYSQQFLPSPKKKNVCCYMDNNKIKSSLNA